MAKQEDIKQETDIREEIEQDVPREDAEIKGIDSEEKVEETVEMDKEEDQAADEDNQELEELNNKLMRLQADFINYKNRVEKDKKNIYSYALEDIITQLLPVLDNFERAMDNMEEGNSYYEGVKMIYDQMMDVLSKNGLKEIECLDKHFDPNFHHAVMSEDSEKEEGIILEVFQKGYMLRDKVIRPSMVKVAK